MPFLVELLRSLGLAVALEPAIRGVAHDLEQPGARVAAVEPGKEAERAQERLLRHVLGIRFPPNEPPREVVGRVEVRHHELLESLTLQGRQQWKSSLPGPPGRLHRSRPQSPRFYSRRP